jgi:hypothetical protein
VSLNQRGAIEDVQVLDIRMCAWHRDVVQGGDLESPAHREVVQPPQLALALVQRRFLDRSHLAPQVVGRVSDTGRIIADRFVTE